MAITIPWGGRSGGIFPLTQLLIYRKVPILRHFWEGVHREVYPWFVRSIIECTWCLTRLIECSIPFPDTDPFL
jgi:hypothetical protein